MEQYYIVQAQNQPSNSPSTPPTNFWTSAPVVWTLLVSGILLNLMNFGLTIWREWRIERKEVEDTKMSNQYTTVLAEVKNEIADNGLKISNLAKNISDLPTRNEFNRLDNRVNELITKVDDLPTRQEFKNLDDKVDKNHSEVMNAIDSINQKLDNLNN